jgi:hypothetical protein
VVPAETVLPGRQGQLIAAAKKLAVKAVISELISVRLFPVLRENTAKFAELCPETTM